MNIKVHKTSRGFEAYFLEDPSTISVSRREADAVGVLVTNAIGKLVLSNPGMFGIQSIERKESDSIIGQSKGGTILY
jgi:hypothetical protein